MPSVTLQELERISEEASAYRSRLRRTYGRCEQIGRQAKVLRQFVTEKGLPASPFLDLLDRASRDGIPCYDLEEQYRSLHFRAAALLLALLKGEQAGDDTTSLKQNWQAFLAREYEETLLAGYEEAIRKGTAHGYLFEIVARKALSGGIQDALSSAREGFSAATVALLQRFTREASSFLHHLRTRLALRVKYDDSFLEATLKGALLIPLPLSEVTIRVLQPLAYEKGFPGVLFDEFHRTLYTAACREQERETLSSFPALAFSSRADLSCLSLPPWDAFSEQGQRALLAMIQERGRRAEVAATEELETLDRLLQEKQSQVSALLEGAAASTRETLRLPAAEPRPVSETLDDVAHSLQRLQAVLASRLALRQELLERRASLERSLRNAHSLTTLTSDDLPGLLGSRTGQPRSALECVYDEYRICAPLLASPPVGLIRELEKMLRQAVAGSPPQSTDYQLLQKVRHERFPKARYDPVPLIRAYGEFVEESIRPLILSKYLEECVRIWPPLREAELLGAAQSVLLEEARYVGEHIVPRDLFFPLSVAPAAQEPARDEEAVAALLVRNFSRLVTVMVYDIRGSTFMGNKLRDAEKEKSIRNAYNRRMLEVGRKYGAFLLKDTGDGGILWFGGNSGHLQETLFSSPSGFENAPRQALPLADDLGPVSSSDSALRAVRCAAEMVHAAEEFVRENLGLYSDWFKAREEKQLFYAGIPFADLPPEYRRIFQIGVGLASGNPRQDLSFGQNAFGDYDVTGTLVREAHFYSLGRHPDRSVIICDGATLLNLLLNCERFALEEARSVSLERQLSPVSMRSVLRQQAEAAFREQQSPGARRYRFSDYGLIIQRIGKRTLAQTESPGTARTIVTDQSGDRFEIDEEAILRDEAKGVVRAVYEIRHLA